MQKKEFIEQLVANNGSLTGATHTVYGEITIDGTMMKNISTIRISDITFNDPLTITGFDHLISLDLLSSNFQGGLLINQINCTTNISILSCRAKHIVFDQTHARNVHMRGLNIGSLNISGLVLSNGCIITEAEFVNLELLGYRSFNKASLRWVETDNKVIAEQCRFAMIPVYLPTAVIRKILGIQATHLS